MLHVNLYKPYFFKRMQRGFLMNKFFVVLLFLCSIGMVRAANIDFLALFHCVVDWRFGMDAYQDVYSAPSRARCGPQQSGNE